MIIKTKGTQYTCSYAEQHDNNIHLYDENNDLRIILENPTIVEVIDGEIEIIAQSPTFEDKVEAQLTYTAMMTGTLLTE